MMKKFTVLLDIDIGQGRNDFMVYVAAPDPLEAAIRAKRVALMDQSLPRSYVATVEILDVFPGHVKSLWCRPEQRPNDTVEEALAGLIRMGKIKKTGSLYKPRSKR